MKYWLVVLTVWILCLHLRIEYEDRQEVENFVTMASACFLKPHTALQASLLVAPDGSAYIPIIFKDEITRNNYYGETEAQWLDKDFEQNGYYAIERLFMPYEYKKDK